MIDLKDAIWVGVRAHPHAAVPVRHAGRIARMGVDRLEQLAVPIDQPRRLIAIRVQRAGYRSAHSDASDLLLPDPQASRCVGHHGQRVGIHARRFEHPGRLRHSRRNRAASPAATAAPAAPARSGVAPPCCASAIAVEPMFSARPAARNSLRFMLMASPQGVLRFRGNVLLELEADLISRLSLRRCGRGRPFGLRSRGIELRHLA